MGVRRNFSRGGQSRHFAYIFQAVGNAMEMDIFKKMSNVTATVAHMVSLVRNFTLSKIFVLGSMDISRLS